MDPNVALAELRELMNDPEYVYDRQRAADLFVGLDEWVSRGGALPRDWQR